MFPSLIYSIICAIFLFLFGVYIFFFGDIKVACILFWSSGFCGGVFICSMLNVELKDGS